MRHEIPGQPYGTIYSFTTVHEAPSTHEEFAPYVEALIDVEQGNDKTRRLSMRMTDIDPAEERRIGDPVEVVTRIWKKDGKRGLIMHGYAARAPIGWQRAEPVGGRTEE
ncbi:MAG: hypothetical protein A2900_00845 [Candidatus Chisholmbacteria bacterium RIFCSPLOWO2_01_FULL_50_28]|uniref:ChsH2 C-terminal OB-fold domain-containing protein n=1 Tax=Candidatus Chisholmbacteria bacterium RIFCSPHIGHO2_01_FULL_52_32 TaxID=1797591 RepID=A0A1G1VUF7_9BACT|nr:MAG: hypothetical protein A2786_05905 [Candidatus Chisholmbacteria bacterium RIFCSPHIGHO2_01_FULL_52_32]OGY19636.1 MAG: hypothetical protein A2900_00845 [Candidatus Chisholmbacteria bacterium RIFCSPLOWO2_01_FULL_50_28]